MRRRRLLDLFCGAGGAAMGYYRAGFEVVGVDVKRQRHYPFEFVQADALTFPLDGFDAVHASPVCLRWSPMTPVRGSADAHPDQISVLRPRLREAGVPYVIENVPEAPLLVPRVLCGSMFGLDVQRHRGFETNWPLPPFPGGCRHEVWERRFAPNRSDRSPRARVVSVTGGGTQPLAVWEAAMGIDWMSRRELVQAVPPAYTAWIGRQLQRYLDSLLPVVQLSLDFG